MLGKCLWKMYSADEETRGQDEPPTLEQVVDCLIRTIEAVPERKDSRKDKEPILEPHYKLVSIMTKLIQRRAIEVSLRVNIHMLHQLTILVSGGFANCPNHSIYPESCYT